MKTTHRTRAASRLYRLLYKNNNVTSFVDSCDTTKEATYPSQRVMDIHIFYSFIIIILVRLESIECCHVNGYVFLQRILFFFQLEHSNGRRREQDAFWTENDVRRPRGVVADISIWFWSKRKLCGNLQRQLVGDEQNQRNFLRLEFVCR